MSNERSKGLCRQWMSKRGLLRDLMRVCQQPSHLKIRETNVQHADRLRQSILKRAFEGKLVPQDANDEPASLLLERIRAERAASKQAANGGRRSRPRRREKKEDAVGAR